MLAEIVTIGDELCRGEIVDSNSAWLAAQLWELDVTVAWMTSCRDEAEDMRRAIGAAVQRSELVLISGGLGPTEDDLTVDVVAQLAGSAAIVDERSLERMQKRFDAAGMKLVDNSLRQVRVPQAARVYLNSAGLAPGFEVTIGATPVVCLPGPPREIEAIYRDHLAARIAELRDDGAGEVERIARRIYRVFGKGESQIADALRELPIGDGASLHYQVKFPETLVKVVVRHRDLELARTRLADIETELRARLGDVVYGTDDDTLASVLGGELRDRGLTLATAESCTGGLVGALLTDVGGASAYYLGGAVCYANSEKVRQLGVREQTLAEHGAVSEACVLEMAEGIRERSGADLGVAVSGVAGPSGGTADKPVGTVWIAVVGPDDARATRKLSWPGARDQIRLLAAYAALALGRRALRGGMERT